MVIHGPKKKRRLVVMIILGSIVKIGDRWASGELDGSPGNPVLAFELARAARHPIINSIGLLHSKFRSFSRLVGG